MPLTVKLSIAEAARKAHAVATGRLLPSPAELPVPLEAMTPEQRAVVLEATGAPERSDAKPELLLPGASGYAPVYAASLVPETPEDWEAVARGLLAAREAKLAEMRAAAERDLAEALPKLEESERLGDEELARRFYSGFPPELKQGSGEAFDAYRARRRAVEARVEAHRTAERKAREARERENAERAEAEKRAEAERRDAEKREWVEAHGSAYLRKAVGGGYDCQRRYVVERAALERPGYVPDVEDAATWNDRACPSEAALDEALRVEGRVVWLTNPARAARLGEWDGDDWEEVEAVVVRGYLGKYDLVREVPGE